MLPRNYSLRSIDVGVLLYLCVNPDWSYGTLAEGLGVSKSNAHAAMDRLLRSRLVTRVGRSGFVVAPGPTREFLLFGVPYMFGAETVSKARGIPTGLSALPVEPDGLDEDVPFVWPSRLGQIIGVGVLPMVPAAPDISFRDPRLYHLLALVDALRLGDARTREIARERMSRSLAEWTS